MSNDKHQALRDALAAPSFMRHARVELVTILLADHDRMRTIVQALAEGHYASLELAREAAHNTLQECGR